MASTFEIRELSFEEMLAQYALIQQLSPQVSEADYREMLGEMVKYDYRMIAVFDGEKCVGISGFWINTKIYCGRYLEPDNVITDSTYRSKGIGKLLMDWLEEEARRTDCKVMMLDAYLVNKAGHKFYEREGFEAKGYHFIKYLTT